MNSKDSQTLSRGRWHPTATVGMLALVGGVACGLLVWMFPAQPSAAQASDLPPVHAENSPPEQAVIGGKVADPIGGKVADPIGGKVADPTRNIVRQGFPAAQADPNDLKKSNTAWEIEWDLTSKDNNFAKKDPGSVLRIVSAKFLWKDSQGQPRSLVVARNLTLAEAFAPYDDNKTAFLDIAHPAYHFRTLAAKKEFLGPTCVAPGEILNSANKHFRHTVYKEVHDDGLRWITGYGPPNKAYRGQKMLLWSILQAGNYCYAVEYNFTDDGRIICRLGFTGHNFFDRGVGKNKAPQGDVHLHIGCWRLEFDLSDGASGGPTKNKLLLVRRHFDKKTKGFKITAQPFGADGRQEEPEAREGKARWLPEEFTILRAESLEVKNKHGRPIAYDLIPTRQGSTRGLLATHQPKEHQANMDFVNADFWVTRTEKQFHTFFRVPEYAKDQRPLANHATTVWHSVPGLHAPRGEDYGVDGHNRREGVALTSWIEFTLRPRDVFDSTPLYPR